MPKKRIHELAKELGLESKVLIARLEKIGISVKSASSTLDDNDYERAKKELTAGELREVVEQRIKTTVIRRRTVVTAVEKQPEEELASAEEANVSEKESADEKIKKALPDKEEKIKKEKPAEAQAKPGDEKAIRADAAKPAEKLSTVEGKPGPLVHPPEEKGSTAEKVPRAEIKEGPAAHPPKESPAAAVKQPVSPAAKPTTITRHKITRPEVGNVAPLKAPLKPGERALAPLSEKPKKKGKYQVEVFIE